jgi:hypothetical protein
MAGIRDFRNRNAALVCNGVSRGVIIVLAKRTLRELKGILIAFGSCNVAKKERSETDYVGFKFDISHDFQYYLVVKTFDTY